MIPEPRDQDSRAGHVEPPRAARAVALLEVLICSDFPTQVAIASTFRAAGFGPFGDGGRLSVPYVVGLSLADTIVLVALVLLFLHTHGERPADVLLGRRRVAPELAAGVPLIFVAVGIAIALLLGIRLVAPFLHTVDQNPFQDLLRTPLNASLFALVVLVAGGVREEIQRAFLLHRFEVWLGGARTGLIVTSVVFGAGHLLQGADAVIVTGMLGAFWGALYLRRRSCLAPMVSHAGFDLLQIAQFMVVGR